MIIQIFYPVTVACIDFILIMYVCMYVEKYYVSVDPVLWKSWKTFAFSNKDQHHPIDIFIIVNLKSIEFLEIIAIYLFVKPLYWRIYFLLNVYFNHFMSLFPFEKIFLESASVKNRKSLREYFVLKSIFWGRYFIYCSPLFECQHIQQLENIHL